MKKIIFTAMSLAALSGCGEKNPLLQDFDTPFQTPPFDRIRIEHYLPAFEKSVAEMKRQVADITADPSTATFENTVVALERAGERLNSVSSIFFNLLEAHTSPAMDSVAMQVQPMLTAAHNDINLDERLFARVKQVWDARESLQLDAQDAMLLEETYKGFTRNGAGLDEQGKQTYREITGELAGLSLLFSQNVLSATNGFEMTLSGEQVAELPDFVKEGMAHDAGSKDLEGYLLTLQAPSMGPYMQYSTDRAVKEKVWRAYGSRAVGGEFDNTGHVKRIAELRLQLANLLGYATYADFALEERMAANAPTVNEFLSELLTAVRPYADKDFETIRQYAAANGLKDFQPWDWAYWQERYKQEKYALNEEQTKPYFELSRVQKGIFMLAEKLYGLTFTPNASISVFHPDVTVYEVHDATGRLMAILYLDFFPRESKRGGAWMTTFREMYTTAAGDQVRPLVSLTCNFTKPTDATPSLLTFREVETFLHEFGHCLHGILAEGKYVSLTGTNVKRDFVELPSQLMENWASQKEFLDLWAVHYQTGEKIPAEMVDKIIAAKNYMAPYLSVRQLFFGLDDMAFHSITAPITGDVERFENRATAGAQMFPPVAGMCVAPSFSHIFPGGYAAGYYSYKWAEVLEADAFSMFEQAGIFDAGVAASFRVNILSRGGSLNPMELWMAFRGHKPDNSHLLRKMGVEPEQK